MENGRHELEAHVSIQPPKSWPRLDLPELWRHRELLGFLVWRDVRVRYKQTVLGAAWAIIQPLMAMALFTIVLQRLAGIGSESVPYPLFAYAALVPWTYHSTAVTQAANSLIQNERVIAKVYFPRLLIPSASIGASLVDFLLSATILFVMMGLYLHGPGIEVLLLPGYLALLLATTAGAGILLGAINVRYRDVRYLLPFGMQMWLFASPIGYPSSLVPEAWRLVYAINPLVVAIDGLRHSLLGTPRPDLGATLVSAISASLLLFAAIRIFRRLETTFADDV